MRSRHMMFTDMRWACPVPRHLHHHFPWSTQELYSRAYRRYISIHTLWGRCSSYRCYVFQLMSHFTWNHHLGYLLWDSSTSLQWTFVLSNTKLADLLASLTQSLLFLARGGGRTGLCPGLDESTIWLTRKKLVCLWRFSFSKIKLQESTRVSVQGTILESI